MSPVTHEPSSLIALRDLHALEQQRRADERAREAAAAQARAAAEAESRRLADAREAAERAVAEQARRDQERRADEERIRAAELAARVRGLQAAHLASVEAELATAARDASRARTRAALVSTAAFGLVGLGLAFLLHSLGRPPAPALVDAGEDPALAEARRSLEQIREDMATIQIDSDAARAALTAAMLARPDDPAPTPTAAPARPRPKRPPAARPDPTTTPTKTGGHLGNGGICKNADDPLAEDC